MLLGWVVVVNVFFKLVIKWSGVFFCDYGNWVIGVFDVLFDLVLVVVR